MKTKLKVLTILFYLLCYQGSFTILGKGKIQKDINQVDSLGLKQGFWVDFEARPKTAGFVIHDLEDGTSKYEDQYIKNDFTIYKYCGEYKNGFRIGIWSIFTMSDRLLFKINYLDGKIAGEYTAYFKNGDYLNCQINQTPKTRVEIFTKDNVLKKTVYYLTKELLEFIFR